MIPTRTLTIALLIGVALPPAIAQDAGGRRPRPEPEADGQQDRRADERDDAGEAQAKTSDRIDRLTDGRVWMSDGDVVVSLGTLEGRIVSVDDEEVALEILDRPGSRATVPIENVANATLFAYFEQRVDKSDPEDLRALAERAAEYDLHFYQADVLGHLAELRPERAEEIRSQQRDALAAGAAARLERARTFREAGEFERAVRAYRDAAACGEVPAAAEARAVLDELDRDEKAREVARAERERRRRAAAADEELDALYAMADEAQATLTEARRNFDDLADAEELLLGAEETLDEALEGLDELAGEQPTDLQSGLRANLQDTLVQVHVELGYVYAALGDEQSARKHAGLAAAVDPNAASVRRLRTAIASRDAFDGVGG